MMSSIPRGTSCLFDTTVFVDYWWGKTKAKQLINQAVKGNIEGNYSIITDAELWTGVNDKKSAKDHKIMLAPHRRYLLNVAIARRSGELLRVYKNQDASLGDMLIAATAEYYGLLLVSRDRTHFLPLQSDSVISLFTY